MTYITRGTLVVYPTGSVGGFYVFGYYQLQVFVHKMITVLAPEQVG